jgi:hypothetical protein
VTLLLFRDHESQPAEDLPASTSRPLMRHKLP